MSTWFNEHEYDSDLEPISLSPYQRMLVVIADAPSVHVTIRHAIELATISQAEINFLAVLNVPAAAGMPDMLAITDDLITGLTQRHQSILDWAADAATYADITSSTRICWGSHAATITYVADATHCDLIVMGMPDTSSWFRFFQPNHAKKVASHARQPVLLVKDI